MPCLYGMTFAVSDIPSSVRPWNAWSNATTADRPVAFRAILTAFSTASAPAFANMVLAGPSIGASSFRRSASSMYGSFAVTWKHVCVSSSACRWTAATTSGAAWPTLSTEMPVAKSIKRLPSTSSTIAPEARAVTTGWRFATPTGTAVARRANHSVLLGPGISVTSFRSCGMSMVISVMCSAVARQALGRPDIHASFVLDVESFLSQRDRDGLRCSVPYNRAMAVTVRDIVSIPGMPLKLLTGEDGADGPVRWVHSSELEDPTAWLKGGELILTTGMGIGDTTARHRAYIRRLVDARVAGLGFGLGFGHARTPRALVTEAAKHGFPLFEVPYPVPFIAITEAVFTRAVAEQYDTLQRAVDAEHVLTRAVLEGGGVEGVAGSLAAVVHGWTLVLDLHGMPLAATDPDAEARRERIWDEVRTSRPEAATFSLTMLDDQYHVWVQPVGAQGRIEAFLAVGTPHQPTQLDRIVAGHALSLFAIELAKSRAVAEAERRLQGDFFDELARGELAPTDASRGLARFGFARDATVFVAAIESAGPSIAPGALALAATDHCSRREGGFVISGLGDGISMLLPADVAAELPELVKGIGQRVD